MTKSFSEIFAELKGKTEQEQVQILRNNNSPALKALLFYGLRSKTDFYTNVVPPYKKDFPPEGYSFSSLFTEHRRLYVFLNDQLEHQKTGKVTSLPRKHNLLIGLLESISPDESQILESIIKGTFSQETGITSELATLAFPQKN